MPDPGTFAYWRRGQPPSILPGFPNWQSLDHFRRGLPLQGLPLSTSDDMHELFGVAEPDHQTGVVEPTHITGAVEGYAP